MSHRSSYIIAIFFAVTMARADVLVDQVGYRRYAQKYVFTHSVVDSFRVINAQSGNVVLRGAFSLWKSNDPATGWTIRRGDFTSITQSGSYYVINDLGDRSPDFVIDDSVYQSVARAALKGFYFQRCGTSLSFANAGFWLHGYCHTTDASFHATAESTGTAAASGGWHDAGDYGKYVVNAGITVGTLLLAYDQYPERFSADNTGIPESNNSIPDILDEVRFELEWMLRMQSGNGGVFTKLTKPQFESFVMPQSDLGTRYIYRISSTATGDLAAVAARASRTFQPFDPAFAERCRAAAVRAWQFLEDHPSIVPVGGFVNPVGTSTGEYGDTDDRDERLWAAAELFAATGDTKYETAYVLGYGDRGLFGGGMSWQTVTPLAHLAYLLATDRTREPSLMAELSSSLRVACDALMTRRNTSGLHLTLVPGDFVWGSNSSALNNAVLLIVASRLLGMPTYLAGAEDQLHYILGVNPFARTFVTGIGSSRPMTPHHRPSASDGVVEPVPGLLVGGPNQFGGDPELDARFTSSTPPAMWYVDDMDSYASNEIAINWNAPLVFVAGVLANENASTGARESTEEVPKNSELLGAFPNPFNAETKIGMRIRERKDVKVTIVDVLGRVVAQLYDASMQPGMQTLSWNASNMASGMYVVRVMFDQECFSRKLVLLR